MKKLKLIYNPFSGDKSFPNYLDDTVSVLQKAGFETHIWRSTVTGDIDTHIRELPRDYYDAMAVSGGDGTLNIAVNAMLSAGLNIPVGIIPSGTANDFASYLSIPSNAYEAAEIIANGKQKKCDAGLVNGKYFVNICSAGIFANIANQINGDLKNIIGKTAYYLQGLFQMANLKPLPMRITNSSTTFEADLMLFLALNSSGAGGFRDLAPNALVNDGKLDFIAIKSRPLMETALFFIKVLKRDFLDDDDVIYFQDDYIKIEPLFENEESKNIDIDGETGPVMPALITVEKNAFDIFVPH